MIAGGMQIMLSRAMDTRAVYVIGVSTPLALSESVFPAYFRNLPVAIRSFASSSLAFSLSAAVVLTLLFPIGTRQIARTSWNDSAGAIASAATFLRGKAKGWSIGNDVADTSATHVHEIIEYIIKQHSHHSEGTLLVLYNGEELRVDISYRGSPAKGLPNLRRLRAPAVGELEDEEAAAAYVGLRKFSSWPHGRSPSTQSQKHGRRRAAVLRGLR